ncbi:MAG: SMC-Scp complex subunit ScpB [Pseudomonadota bacterium]
MNELDGEAARDFKGLDARETQQALADEIAGDADEAELEASDQQEKGEGGTPLKEAGVEAKAVTEEAAEEERPEEAALVEDGDAAVSDEETSPADGDEDAREASSEAEDGDAQDEAAAPEWTEEDIAEHVRMVEALLFAAAEPLDVRSIADRLPAGADIATIMDELAADYEGRGVTLSKIANKWRFVTAVDVAHVLEKEKVQQRKLSRAALETLAIIAYHQPCTRADIEDVRGVAVSKGSLDQLLEIGWVRLRGKREAPGRPTLFGTSQSFLEHFGLSSVEDLPGLADLKAAGLLDARLPPGFTVPSPAPGDEDEDAEEGENAEFAQDFLSEEDQETAEG